MRQNRRRTSERKESKHTEGPRRFQGHILAIQALFLCKQLPWVGWANKSYKRIAELTEGTKECHILALRFNPNCYTSPKERQHKLDRQTVAGFTGKQQRSHPRPSIKP